MLLFVACGLLHNFSDFLNVIRFQKFKNQNVLSNFWMPPSQALSEVQTEVKMPLSQFQAESGIQYSGKNFKWTLPHLTSHLTISSLQLFFSLFSFFFISFFLFLTHYPTLHVYRLQNSTSTNNIRCSASQYY